MTARPVKAATAVRGRDYGVVTIDLRPERGDVPTHLCVVSEVAGPRARKTLGQLMRGAPDDRGEVQLNTSLWPEFGNSRECATPGICGPKIKVPGAQTEASEYSVACVTDGLESSNRERDPKLLVIMLEHLEGSPPAIDSLNLAGGVATIGVLLNLRRVVVTTHSLGGHYQAHDRSYHADVSDHERKIVSLSISPRCAWTPLVLPGARITERDRPYLRITAQGENMDPEQCVGPLEGNSTLRAMLPPGDTLGRIDIERIVPKSLPKPAEDSDAQKKPSDTANNNSESDKQPPQSPKRKAFTPTVSYRGQWRGRWPDEVVELQPTRVHFRWRPPECIYSRLTCPAARLASGQYCRAHLDERGCAYQCPGHSGTRDSMDRLPSISLPVEVTFEKADPVQRWSDNLESIGQVLTSYVDPSRRYLSADISSWRTETPGSRVSHVELLLSDGGVRRYSVEGRRQLHMRVPHASCEMMRYRIEGDRDHKEMLAPVQDGHVWLAPPEDSARMLSFGLSLLQGGGPSLPIRSETEIPKDFKRPSTYSGLIQLALNFRMLNPTWARLSWDLRVGANIGQWGYTIQDEPRRFGWMRFLAGFAAVVDLWPNVQASAGVDFGGSWPIKYDSEFPRETKRSTLILPSTSLRLGFRRNLALEIQARAVIGESYWILKQNIKQQRVTVISVFGLTGLRLQF